MPQSKDSENIPASDLTDDPENRVSILLLAICSALAMQLCFWVCDDAYISFRYARNLANGLGLTYNPSLGQPIEGYSNFLWVLISAIFELWKLPVQIVMPYLSISCALILIFRLYNLIRKEFQLTSTTASMITATSCISAPFLIWSTSGLATIPFALAIFLFFEICFTNSKGHGLFFDILVTTSLILVRAEGFAWAISIGLLAIILGSNRKRIFYRIIPSIALVTLGLLLFRLYYFNAWMPNTASAKVGFSVARLYRGLDYITVYLLTFITPIIACLGLFRLKTLLANRTILAAVFLFFAFFAYSVLVGGDYMSMGRFLVPSIPFQALMIGMLLRNTSKLVTGLACATLLLINLLPFFDIYISPQSLREKFHFRLNRSSFVNENDHWRFMKTNSQRWRKKGETLARFTSPDESIVEGAIGNVGYFSNLTIYDRMGLVSKIRMENVPKTLRSPGHDVRVPYHYFLPQEPTYLYGKAMGVTGLSRLAKQRKDYPFPYAPEVHELRVDNRNKFFVLMKRQISPDQYKAAWANLDTMQKAE